MMNMRMGPDRTPLILVVGFLSMVAGGIGCDTLPMGPDDNTNTNINSNNNSNENSNSNMDDDTAPPVGIGAEGGEVEDPTGAKIEIPAGALDSNVSIEIVADAGDAPALGSGFTTYGKIFALLPHGTTFKTPVTISIPFDPAQVPAGETPKLFKAEVGGMFTEIPAAVQGGLLVAAVSNFSFVGGMGPSGSEPSDVHVVTISTLVESADEHDHVTSLREAILAAAGAGTTEIRFDPAVFFDAETFAVKPIQLSEPLIIPTGVDLIIDGSLTFGGFNVEIMAETGMRQNLITVDSGAFVTFRDLYLHDGNAQGAQGFDGSDGEPAGPGEQGNDSLTPGGAGADAVGGILNRGNLTLEHVKFNRLEGHAGNGGHGGQGGNGGTDVSGTIPGGLGGSGTPGGIGGDGAGAIFNYGVIVVRDALFQNCRGFAGAGGEGGWGGRGGSGSSGGRGGNGSEGGKGGNGSGAIYNLGSVTFDAPQPDISASVESVAGLGGRGGFKGDGGNAIGGGSGGANGTAGFDGEAGGHEPFWGLSPQLENVFVVSVGPKDYSDSGDVAERTVSLRFESLGGTGNGRSVKWTVEPGPGVTAADFVDGFPAGGKVEFENSTTGTSQSFTLANDGLIEGDEFITITLSDPVGGLLGWREQVTIGIHD